MKLVFTLFLSSALLQVYGQNNTIKKAGAAQIVEASCGKCQFGMQANDCSLAVRINGQAYFVDGSGIDEHGDAHAGDGFCNAVRKALVKGELINGRFKAVYFKLLSAKKKCRPGGKRNSFEGKRKVYS